MQKKTIIKLSKLAVPFVASGRFNREKKNTSTFKQEYIEIKIIFD